MTFEELFNTELYIRTMHGGPVFEIGSTCFRYKEAPHCGYVRLRTWKRIEGDETITAIENTDGTFGWSRQRGRNLMDASGTGGEVSFEGFEAVTGFIHGYGFTDKHVSGCYEKFFMDDIESCL